MTAKMEASIYGYIYTFSCMSCALYGAQPADLLPTEKTRFRHATLEQTELLGVHVSPVTNVSHACRLPSPPVGNLVQGGVYNRDV